MSITVKEDRYSEVHQHHRTIEFEGAEPVLLERTYSHGGKYFLPMRASCGWDHGAAITQITVEGFLLKKDGTPSQQRTDLEYITPAHGYWDDTRGWHTKAPEWLLELFGIAVPPVDLDVPTEDMGQ